MPKVCVENNAPLVQFKDRVGNKIGRIDIKDDKLKFSGNMAESAKIFFRDFMKPVIDKHFLKKKLEVRAAKMPCPFCCNAECYGAYATEGDNESHRTFIECSKCGTHGPVVNSPLGIKTWREDSDKAWDLWNKWGASVWSADD
ncbi:hypothetical protein LCGC14_2323080 [marine sediment metagenome]|uniref:Uncharacterized protein n=1 Tax=marine sediment metagenome TaxID=412755 RepID=A0A0F9FBY7_9ZZZZ